MKGFNNVGYEEFVFAALLLVANKMEALFRQPYFMGHPMLLVSCQK